MGLFSKLKDYNVELDEILDNKTFSSNIKSLLLSMIYKIEISYVDFKEVKRCVRSKEDFLNEIVETVRLYCDNIKTVEPDSDQAAMCTGALHGVGAGPACQSSIPFSLQSSRALSTESTPVRFLIGANSFVRSTSTGRQVSNSRTMSSTSCSNL